MNNNAMKIIDENEIAWQLDNGLWYEKKPIWGGICPRCGREGGMCYHVWRVEYFVCEDCMISWEIGSNLFSGWRYMDDEDFIYNLEFLSETEDMCEVYGSLPINSETVKMLDTMRGGEGNEDN